MRANLFYKSLRRRNSGVFGTSLSQRQVDGIEAILAASQGYPLPHVAHCLSEAYHETGGTMAPVRETFAKTTDVAIARLERAWKKGHLTWVRRPYWRKDGDGKSWLGRGFVQLTHRDNYEKAAALTSFDLVGSPDLAMQPKAAAKILCEGCRIGMFTSKRLSHFDSPTGYDHYNARAIVNGDKGKNGKLIVKYARAFEAALSGAGYKQAPDSAKQPPLSRPSSNSTEGSLGAFLKAILARFGVRK